MDTLKEDEIIPELKEVLTELKDYVENINKAPQMVFKEGIYKQRNKDDIQVTRFQMWSFGYQIEERGDFFIRKCFIKAPGKWNAIPNHTKDSITVTVLDAMFLDQQSEPTIIPISDNTICIGQKFQVEYLYEKSPKLVSISNRGD